MKTPQQIKPYLSNSQINSFDKCEAAAIAEITGEYSKEKTPAMLVGSYVDAYFSGSLEKFKKENPEIFTNKGELRSDFKQAEKVIEVAENDELIMKYLSGDKQVKVSGKIEGVDFFGYIDVNFDNIIVDLKILADFEPAWDKKERNFVNFIDRWNIAQQLAIYAELEHQRTGVKKECYIVALTKEKVTDKSIIHIPSARLSIALSEMKSKLSRITLLKNGLEKPIRCEKCDYCKSTKKAEIISYYNL